MTVTNNGPQTATHTDVKDTLPAQFSFSTFTFGPGTIAGTACTLPASGGSGTIDCGYPPIAAGQSQTFSIVGHILASTPSGTSLTNSVTGRSDQVDPVSANNTATVHTLIPSLGGGGDNGGGGSVNPGATPELDSLLLFGSGLAGMAGYALLRLRRRR